MSHFSVGRLLRIKTFVANYSVVLVSFADNATFAATSLEELRFCLVAGCYNWCSLLGVRLNATKPQLWCYRGVVGRLKFGDDMVVLATRATFRVVGIELGASERAVTDAHLAGWFRSKGCITCGQLRAPSLTLHRSAGDLHAGAGQLQKQHLETQTSAQISTENKTMPIPLRRHSTFFFSGRSRRRV